MHIDYLSSGKGNRPVLLMLHGIGGSAECFRPQLQAFAGDYHAVAWNMPGYGKSTPLETPGFAALAGAVAVLLDELGASAVHLLGHSIGGMIAQQFVADCPDRVSSLTLVATTAAFGGRDGAFQKRFIEERLGPLDRGATMRELAASIIDSLVGREPDREALLPACQAMAAVPEAAYRANMELLVTFDLRSKLGDIRVPTLLVAGEMDRNAPPPVMEKMSTFIRGARFEVIRNAGHLVNLEQPDAFNSLLQQFLQTVAT